MDRRKFCFQIVASVSFTAVTKGSVSAADTAPNIGEDAYMMWSLLIPSIQPKAGHGYMVVQQIATPDAPPYVQVGPPKRAIYKARDASRLQALGPYETFVPDEFRSSFSQAVIEASELKPEKTIIDRRLQLPKRYRLLSQDQLKSYMGIDPPAVASGWKPDEKAVHEYRGWNAVSYLSRPYFDQAHQLALIWAGTRSECFDSSWYFFTRTQHVWERLNWRTEGHNQCF